MEYKFDPPRRKCSSCGRALPDDSGAWFSALSEGRKGAFERVEFCSDCFESVDKTTFFSYWRRKRRSGSARVLFDADGALALLQRLIEAGSHPELLTALVLLLLRRRVLDLLDIVTEDGVRYMLLRRGKERLRVPEAPLSAERVESLRGQLIELFEQV